MGILGGEPGYQLLRHLWAGHSSNLDGSAYSGKSKLEVLLGPHVYKELLNKVVIDFGCGEGTEAIELAQHGVRRVIRVDIDIQDRLLVKCRRRALEAGVADRCEFVTATHEKCDVILSLDSFEHFSNPLAILHIMRDLLKPEGYVWTSFGPTWYHPYGGHGFSPFPWAHLIFTEKTLTRRLRDLWPTNIQFFSEYWEGLGQLTIAQFEHVVKQARFEFISFDAVPIRRLRLIHNKLTREFSTSVVRAKFRPNPRSM